MLHAPIIKYIFEIHLSIICIITGGKNGKENMEGLKACAVQLSTIVVSLCIGTLLYNQPVKGSILLDFLYS